MGAVFAIEYAKRRVVLNSAEPELLQLLEELGSTIAGVGRANPRQDGGMVYRFQNSFTHFRDCDVGVAKRKHSVDQAIHSFKAHSIGDKEQIDPVIFQMFGGLSVARPGAKDRPARPDFFLKAG